LTASRALGFWGHELVCGVRDFLMQRTESGSIRMLGVEDGRTTSVLPPIFGSVLSCPCT
jgi:hypothetical protein